TGGDTMNRWVLCALATLLCFATAVQVAAQTGGGVYYDLGVFAYEEGKFKEAESLLQKALGMHPQEPFANHIMGKTLMAQGRYKEAEKYLNAAWKNDPDLSGLAYDRAYLSFKLERYGEGADRFEKVIQADPNYILASFYGGICLYRKARYRDARTLLLSAAEKSPELKIEGFYYAALCDYYVGQERDAVEKLNFVKANTDSNEVKDNADRWLKRMETGKKIDKPYELEIRVGYAYDSNVPLDSTEQDNYTPSGQDDTALFGYAGGSYNVVNRQDMKLGLGLSRAQCRYNELDEFNASETAGQLFGYGSTKPFFYGLRLRPILYQVDEEDFLLVYEVVPMLVYKLSKTWEFGGSYTFSANDYRQDAYDERDGSSHEVYAAATYNFSGEKGYTSAGIGYEDYAAESNAFDFGRLTLKFVLETETLWDLTLRVAGRFSVKTYKNEDEFENETRQDNRFEGVVSLKHRFFYDWLSLSLEYDYYQNESNLEDYSYSRQLAGIILLAEF
ncbi:MAG: tetratricopeptide repeat protein, partial [Deltaproteobacteria bacterium]